MHIHTPYRSRNVHNTYTHNHSSHAGSGPTLAIVIPVAVFVVVFVVAVGLYLLWRNLRYVARGLRQHVELKMLLHHRNDGVLSGNHIVNVASALV